MQGLFQAPGCDLVGVSSGVKPLLPAGSSGAGRPRVLGVGFTRQHPEAEANFLYVRRTRWQSDCGQRQSVSDLSLVSVITCRCGNAAAFVISASQTAVVYERILPCNLN